MRLKKAWTVASKDFRTFTKRKSIIYSIIGFEVFVSIGMPFIIRFIASNPSGVAVLPTFMNAFSFWFVIGASL
jgi:lipid-A-disaccharide synthase-like uncharacterized protein